MCGIFFQLQDSTIFTKEYIDATNVACNLLNHRGPDSKNSEIITCNNDKSIYMFHSRLHIVGDSTPQPITDEEKSIYLIINGEIFNWRELSEELDYECHKSDCEVIIPLYKKYVREYHDFRRFFNKLNGQYSFVLYDSLKERLFISRDHIGITPMYYSNSTISFSSEMKVLVNLSAKDIKTFTPRHYIYANINNYENTCELKPYMKYEEIDIIENELVDDIKNNIKNKLENSIKMQLKDLISSNSPKFGVLLSGGLDSSLVASIVSRNTTEKIKTFSIGMNKNSNDLIAARRVAEFLGTDHYEFYFTSEEGISIIRDVIWYTESYDTTTIRASVPMFLLIKKIKEKFPDIKVLFSGELSDEMFCYLYGKNAPSEDEYRKEVIKLVNNVHLFDCLRANKTGMANSIEIRVPFTDPNFVKYILSIPPKYKTFGILNSTRMEKQLLRDSFDSDYLPKDILYRKKEAFSDGVSNQNGNKDENWIDSITEYSKYKYGELSYAIKSLKYTYNKPLTKEQLYYREIFKELFKENNGSDLTVEFWKPNWCGENVDPSARKHLNW